jgi:hypothetical protein
MQSEWQQSLASPHKISDEESPSSLYLYRRWPVEELRCKVRCHGPIKRGPVSPDGRACADHHPRMIG